MTTPPVPENENSGSDESQTEDDADDNSSSDAPPAPEPEKKGTVSSVVLGGDPTEIPKGDGIKRIPFEQKHFPGMPPGIVLDGQNSPVYVRGRKVSNLYIELSEPVYIAHRPYRSTRYTFTQLYTRGTRLFIDRCVPVENRP